MKAWATAGTKFAFAGHDRVEESGPGTATPQSYGLINHASTSAKHLVNFDQSSKPISLDTNPRQFPPAYETPKTRKFESGKWPSAHLSLPSFSNLLLNRLRTNVSPKQIVLQGNLGTGRPQLEDAPRGFCPATTMVFEVVPS